MMSFLIGNDSLRVKGAEITTASEATVSFAIEDAVEDDFSHPMMT